MYIQTISLVWCAVRSAQLLKGIINIAFARYRPRSTISTSPSQLYITTVVHPYISRSTTFHDCLLYTIAMCDNHNVVRPVGICQLAICRTEPTEVVLKKKKAVQVYYIYAVLHLTCTF